MCHISAYQQTCMYALHVCVHVCVTTTYQQTCMYELDVCVHVCITTCATYQQTFLTCMHALHVCVHVCIIYKTAQAPAELHQNAAYVSTSSIHVRM
jgi:hypothetical protein